MLTEPLCPPTGARRGSFIASILHTLKLSSVTFPQISYWVYKGRDMCIRYTQTHCTWILHSEMMRGFKVNSDIWQPRTRCLSQTHTHGPLHKIPAGNEVGFRPINTNKSISCGSIVFLQTLRKWKETGYWALTQEALLQIIKPGSQKCEREGARKREKFRDSWNVPRFRMPSFWVQIKQYSSEKGSLQVILNNLF